VLAAVSRLRRSGIAHINIDLIAGLPHQTAESWNDSVESAIALGVPHVSVYMLEVDEDSRLGRELIAGGTRYHAHFVPDEELTADLYESACERLNAAGNSQYEISNFARAGFESRHNLKYWKRQPYVGFGVDAHSMLLSVAGELESVRFSTPDSLEQYVANAPLQRIPVSRQAALEETLFLGLRLTEGVNLEALRTRFGTLVVKALEPTLVELGRIGLMDRVDDQIQLTPRGRLLSNEVFARFLTERTAT
jgi:oxygen-independent coproporphyrinogen III oxidase